LSEFQPVGTDSIFVPTANQVWSVSSGAVNWASGDAAVFRNGFDTAAVAGSRIIFISGTDVVAQSY